VKETRVAAAVIFNSQGQVLLAQRAEPEFLKGLWEFPGGKIEDSESAELALHREIQEELELRIKIDFLIGEFTNTYQNHSVRILAFAVQALNADFQVRDHLDVRWVEPHELQNYRLVPADADIFPALISLQNGK
jgi:mutator protein MutT